ncbi:hypothetical protein QFC22_002650 [Naganishia vaughanmartiniae]|uniref:Uncharacterized protein n=1 Tax=Naganishia vaughanmartiniae TaxID=1424756 RepID=A0ACC2XBG9_9TREE|nr:hypothetical protein QFC22_002650 [Naganishia vaughanmartiniae]
MSDEEFDDFSIDDDALIQFASIEQSVGNSDGVTAARNPAKSVSSAWSVGARPPAGKSPVFQLRNGLPQTNTRSLSGSDSNGLSVVSAAIRPSTTINNARVPQGFGTAARKLVQNGRPPISNVRQTSMGNTNTRKQKAESDEVNLIEVLSDGDDPEIEFCSPPPGHHATKKVDQGTNCTITHTVTSAETARVARANAIRGLTGFTNGGPNWLTNAQKNRQNGATDRTITKQTNNKNVKVTEWDSERPQVQVLQTHLPFRPTTPRKTGKTWDRTAYSKSGQRIVKRGSAKKTGPKKKKAGGGGWDDEASDVDLDEEEEEEDDENGFDQFPMPFIDPSTYQNRFLPENAPLIMPCFSILSSRQTDTATTTPATGVQYINIHLPYQLSKARISIRDRQELFYAEHVGGFADRSRKDVYSGDSPVELFPAGKLVFLMPTKPLVTQQHEACQESCGIPSADAATITGDDPDNWREAAWRDKRVFYATPQTFRNDMARGRVDPMDVVLVIVGRTPEKVQEIVDNLHISHIEIREAESPEISRYMYKKNIYRHRISMGDEIMEIIDIWVQFMKPLIEQLIKAGVLSERARCATQIKPFTIQSVSRNAFANKNYKVAYPAMLLWHLTDALSKLMEYTTTMFMRKLRAIADETLKGVTKAAKADLQNNPEFRKLERRVDLLLNETSSGADRHPKLRTMKDLVVKHFEHAYNAADESGNPAVTRCMIFCSFRDGVTEIVDTLNEANPLIRAHKFVGKANSSKDDTDKGLTQKQQKEVIEKFRKNDYNVLVATSIGEEGLDIGEVDFIIIYNCPNSSIKMLQRVGRAGRKRDGQIHVFMTEGREDGNWDTALLSHQEMQSEIITGRNIELYDDVERLLPEGTNPTCIEQVLSIDPYVPEDKAHNKKKRKAAAGAKTSKAKKARGEPVPEGALDGFIMASSLTKKGKKLGSAKKGTLGIRTDLLPGADSDSDSDDMTTLSQLGRSRDDDDDSEEDTPPSPKKSRARLSASSKVKSARALKRSLDMDTESPLQAKFTKASALHTSKERSYAGPSTRKPVPVRKKKTVVVEESDSEEDEDEDPLGLSFASKDRTVTSGEPQPTSTVTPRNTKAKEILPSSDFSNIDSRWMLDLDDDEFDSHMPSKGSTFKTPSAVRNTSSRSMPPPSFIPARALVKTPSTVEPSPIPIRKAIKKRIILATSSDGEEGRSARLPSSDKERLDFTSPTVPLGARPTKPRPRRLNHLIEDDVAVEGDTTMGDDLSGEESDSDRRFAGQFEPTQAPNGFNQRAAYLAGLSTQGRPGGPDFSDHSDQHGRFLAKARRPVFLSQEDDATREGPSSEYEGSFVCGDDTVEYESDEDI